MFLSEFLIDPLGLLFEVVFEVGFFLSVSVFYEESFGDVVVDDDLVLVLEEHIVEPWLEDILNVVLLLEVIIDIRLFILNLVSVSDLIVLLTIHQIILFQPLLLLLIVHITFLLF